MNKRIIKITEKDHLNKFCKNIYKIQEFKRDSSNIGVAFSILGVAFSILIVLIFVFSFNNDDPSIFPIFLVMFIVYIFIIAMFHKKLFSKKWISEDDEYDSLKSAKFYLKDKDRYSKKEEVVFEE